MSYLKRRDWFVVGVVLVCAVAHYFYDVDASSFSWPAALGLLGCIVSLYLAFVQIPGIGEELAKQREVNEKLSDQLIDLKEKIRYGK